MTGNAGRRPLPVEPELPKPEAEALRAPTGLKGEGKKEWERLVQPLIDAGVLTAADMGHFGEYCRIVSLVDDLERTVAKGYADAKKLGYVNDLTKMLKLRKEYAVELGLTPSSRTRVKPVAKPQAGDTTEEMLFGVGRTA